MNRDAVEALCESFGDVSLEAPAVRAYKQLVARVDEEVGRLVRLHEPHLRCRPGCDACCHVERTVNRLEAYWIWQALSTSRPLLPEPQPGRCALLVDRLCALYPARPILCRTHGLPLVYFDRGEIGVTHCQLNFKYLDAGGFEASEVLEMAPINARLLELDRQFCQQHLRRPWDPQLRVPLAELVTTYNERSRTPNQKREPL